MLVEDSPLNCVGTEKEKVKLDPPVVRPINDAEADVIKDVIFCFFFFRTYIC